MEGIKEFVDRGKAPEGARRGATARDAGAAALAEGVGKRPQLTARWLDSNPSGDAGDAALAEAAGKLPQLTTLDLRYNPNISQQAKDALKAALPDCDVKFEF